MLERNVASMADCMSLAPPSKWKNSTNCPLLGASPRRGRQSRGLCWDACAWDFSAGTVVAVSIRRRASLLSSTTSVTGVRGRRCHRQRFCRWCRSGREDLERHRWPDQHGRSLLARDEGCPLLPESLQFGDVHQQQVLSMQPAAAMMIDGRPWKKQDSDHLQNQADEPRKRVTEIWS